MKRSGTCLPRLLRFAALAVAAALALAGGASAAESGPNRTLVFFGDSLTAGYGLEDPSSESFVARIEQKIAAEHLPWTVVNAGLSGETSAGGLRRVDWVLHQKPDVFVLELGANDGLRGLPTSAMHDNLQAILGKVRSKYPDCRLVLAGIRMPSSLGSDYASAFHAVFVDLAKKNALVFIPFLLEGVAGNPALNQGDGIHPTAAGDQIVAETLWKALRPLLAQVQ